ncbi:MAG: hypothetical protein WC942_04845 [Clostridia bacterium]|jgi:hypothetical protein
MATNVVTLLRSLQGLEVGPNEAPITVIDADGNWVGSITKGTPVKTAAASGTFTLSDPVVDGELVTIGTDIYEFDIDAAVTEGNITLDVSGSTKTQATATLTISGSLLDGEVVVIGDDTYEATTTGTASGSNIAIDLSLVSTAATGTLSFTDVVSDGEVVVIGDDTYEFDTNDSVTDGNIQVFVGANTDAPSAIIALVAAVEAAGTEEVSAVDGDGNTVVVTGNYHRFADNSIATTTTCAKASWGAEHLESGADATAAACVTALALAIETHNTIDVAAVDGDDDTVVVTADAAGAVDGSLGNAVAVYTDSASATWGESVTALSGGTDATAIEAMAILETAVGVSGDGTYTLVDNDDGTATVTAVTEGDAGNLIATTTTCANGSWGEEVTTLSGGADGTPAVIGTIMQDESYIYMAIDDTEDSTGWKKTALSAL